MLRHTWSFNGVNFTRAGLYGEEGENARARTNIHYNLEFRHTMQIDAMLQSSNQLSFDKQ